jgi:hypothetical protein
MKKSARRERLTEGRSPNFNQPDLFQIFGRRWKPNNKAGIEAPAFLKLFPNFFADSCLMQYPQKKFSAYVALMRIGDSNGDYSIDHKLVFTP